MKVGAYVTGYEPESGGGYTFETDVLLALAEAADTSRHTFSILTPESSLTALHADARFNHLDMRGVPDTNRVQRKLSFLERESAILRAHWRKPSALDQAAAAAGLEFLWFLGAGIHRTDLPYLTVVWDLQHLVTPWFPEMTAGGLWDMRELGHSWFLRRATSVVTGTRRGQEELLRYYQVSPERTLLLPHPTPRFALEAGKQSEIPALPRGVREPFIFYPAQFWGHKNHVNLVLALAHLKHERKIDLSLVLVGSDKGNRAHVEQAARAAGVAESVIFPGFVSRDELVALYRRAVALTYVSFCGPENLPPVEAFALGCPVVASLIPGAEEQLGECALLAAPDRPQEIAAAIERVLREPQTRTELVARGKARAQDWTARDYVSRVISFLDRFEPIRRSWGASTL